MELLKAAEWSLSSACALALQVQEFGVCEVRDLKPNGANILVTEENKKEYVHLVCQMKMTGEYVYTHTHTQSLFLPCLLSTLSLSGGSASLQ